jgi:PAP2 superfamily C-terminal
LKNYHYLTNPNLTVKNTSANKKEEIKTLSLRPNALSLSWSNAWKIPSFRWKFLTGLVIFAGILTALPFFFDAIEDRNGLVMTDFILERIPVHNTSVAVFFLIWSCCILLVIRIYRDPMMLLVILWAYNGVTLVRMASIGLISLNPPAGLIPLADPITNLFYGAHYITHDLFFSGHTTTVFLVFLCLKRKSDRIYALLASIALGILLLVQHVHYTVDVLAAPLFTYIVYRLALLFTKRENQGIISNRNQV